jgi:hypothetical protein
MKRTALRWKLVSIFLMAAGIGWVAYLLASTVDELSRFVPDSIGWLMVATFLVALSIAMMIIIFGLFLNSGADRGYPPAIIARLHVAGQLLRYLPGRLWGLAFQISTSREIIPAARLARANLDYMIFSVIGSLSIGFVLLAHQGLWPWWPAAAVVAGGGLILGGMFLGAANRILLRLGRCLPARAQRMCELLAMGSPTLARLGAIAAVFIASWVVYLAGWSMLGHVFQAFVRIDFIALCAYYTLASGIGILSLLTPAGLGVREAAFVILAAGSADRETVAFFAAFGRIWLMFIEMTMLVLVPIFLPMKKKTTGAIDPRGTCDR